MDNLTIDKMLQVANASLRNDTRGFLDDSSEATHGIVSIDSDKHVAYISILASILTIKNGKLSVPCTLAERPYG